MLVAPRLESDRFTPVVAVVKSGVFALRGDRLLSVSVDPTDFTDDDDDDDDDPSIDAELEGSRWVLTSNCLSAMTRDMMADTI